MSNPAPKSTPVPAAEFTRNFGRYRMLAQREPVAVTSHGTITGFFLSPEEYKAFQQFKAQRRNVQTMDMPEEKVRKIAAGKMNTRHDHLNAMLDP